MDGNHSYLIKTTLSTLFSYFSLIYINSYIEVVFYRCGSYALVTIFKLINFNGGFKLIFTPKKKIRVYIIFWSVNKYNV